MQLVSATQVLSRMNLLNLGGDPAAIVSAIEGATHHVEAMLQTELSEHTRIDYYSIGGVGDTFNKIDLSSNQVLSLELSQRYLTTAAVQVYVNTSDVYKRYAIGNMTEIDQSLYAVDRIKGIITLYPPFYPGLYSIAVRYIAGFKEEDDKLPPAIAECAILASAAINYATSVTVGKKETKNRADGMLIMARNAISSLLISNRSAVTPSYTEVIK